MVASLRDDHAFAALDAADAGDDAGGMDGVVVHAVGGKRRELQERRAGIDQRHHALAREQFAAPDMPRASAVRAAGRGFRALAIQLRDQRLHLRGIAAELIGARIGFGRDLRHAHAPWLVSAL